MIYYDHSNPMEDTYHCPCLATLVGRDEVQKHVQMFAETHQFRTVVLNDFGLPATHIESMHDALLPDSTIPPAHSVDATDEPNAPDIIADTDRKYMHFCFIATAYTQSDGIYCRA